MRNTIYIISGPAGAGKSTTSKRIAQKLPKSAYIPGDEIDHMVVGGHEKPWLSQYHTDLIWLNILSLTKNYIQHGHDVVIDYVAFMKNANVILQEFRGYDVVIKYVLLLPQEEELVRRDAERKPEFQMGYRSVAGLHELLETNPPVKHRIDTTFMDVDAVIEEIMRNDDYYVTEMVK
ncbi:AAA family ATPase [Paenibacillus solisilvae]|uniref:AAA family ATPase n=1 Tax=Paenibacillus solisilvae TaxID=2486751 RepID=A0ABW0W5C0_9BACL